MLRSLAYEGHTRCDQQLPSPRRIEVDSLLLSKLFNLPVFSQIGLALVLNIVIQCHYDLPTIVYLGRPN